jgi:hypothetical protein
MTRASFWKAGVSIAALSVLLFGCAMTREPSRTPRTAVEQLLLSQALTRSLEYLAVPLAPDDRIYVEIAGFPHDRSVLEGRFLDAASAETSPPPRILRHPASDLPVMQSKIEARLGELGAAVRPGPDEADYRIRVTVEALGTEQGESFVGMPPVQSVLLPFALPQLTLYRAQRQQGYVRFTLDLYEARTGRLLRSTAAHEGKAYYTQFTAFFFVTWEGTDLTSRP